MNCDFSQRFPIIDSDAPNRISILGTHCTVMISPTWLASAGVRDDVYQPWSPEKRGTESCSDTFRSQLRLWWSLRTCHHFPSHARARQMRQRHQHNVTMRSGRHAWHRHITATLSMHRRVWEPVRGGRGDEKLMLPGNWSGSSQAKPHMSRHPPPQPSRLRVTLVAHSHTFSQHPPDPINSNLKQTHAL